ncbi:MAG: FHA domain-containing protein [Verrucomicrobia bacterium]|nr:FHA domain-containing protein [Verrucomicrobiota bacterium]
MAARILIVTNNRQSLDELTARFGEPSLASQFRVEGADSLDAALAAARAGPVDLLVTDLRVGAADGVHIAEAVRSLSPGVKLLFNRSSEPDNGPLAVAVGKLGPVVRGVSAETILDALKPPAGPELGAAQHEMETMLAQMRQRKEEEVLAQTRQRLQDELAGLRRQREHDIETALHQRREQEAKTAAEEHRLEQQHTEARRRQVAEESAQAKARLEQELAAARQKKETETVAATQQRVQAELRAEAERLQRESEEAKARREAAERTMAETRRRIEAEMEKLRQQAQETTAAEERFRQQQQAETEAERRRAQELAEARASREQTELAEARRRVELEFAEARQRKEKELQQETARRLAEEEQAAARHARDLEEAIAAHHKRDEEERESALHGLEAELAEARRRREQELLAEARQRVEGEVEAARRKLQETILEISGVTLDWKPEPAKGPTPQPQPERAPTATPPPVKEQPSSPPPRGAEATAPEPKRDERAKETAGTHQKAAPPAPSEPNDADLDRALLQKLRRSVMEGKWDYVLAMGQVCVDSPHLAAADKEWCMARLGEARVLKLKSSEARDDLRRPGPRLTVRSGPLAGKVFIVTGPRMTVGRDGDNDIRLEDTTVSGHHAEIVPQSDGILLRDLKSTNGTNVNGKDIAEAKLQQGDTIFFGGIETVFALGGDA